MSTVDARDTLSSALFPKARRAVLGLLYAHPDQPFYLRRIVEYTGLGTGHVQREVQRLADAGIIRRTPRDRHVYFQADRACPIFADLRGLVTKTVGAATVLRAAVRPLRPRLRVAFIFGSVARSDERHASDLDLLVIGDVTFGEVTAALRGAEAQLRREINVSVYPPAEFRSKLARRNHFLTAVLKREKLFVVGDAHELGALFQESHHDAPGFSARAKVGDGGGRGGVGVGGGRGAGQTAGGGAARAAAARRGAPVRSSSFSLLRSGEHAPRDSVNSKRSAS